jgi:hypothetical protein
MPSPLTRFPYPLVISTEQGYLSYANKAAKERFGFSDIRGPTLNFARLFAPKSPRGNFMYEYAERFSLSENPDAASATSHHSMLSLEFEGRKFYGDTLPLISGSGKKLLTIFLEVDHQQ